MDRHWQAAAALTAALLLAACGGGEGGGGEGPRSALPLLAQDAEPAATGGDVRALDYYPAHVGDSWVLDDPTGAGTTMRRQVTVAEGETVVYEDTVGGGTVTERRYRRTAAGFVRIDPLGPTAMPALRAAVAEWLELPEQLPADGEVRERLRQGPLDADIDGDGHADSYRVTLRQVVVGRETVVLPDGRAVQALHVSGTQRVELIPSVRTLEPYGVVASEEGWWAPGLGLVRWRGATVDTAGRPVAPVREFRVSAARIDGQMALGAR